MTIKSFSQSLRKKDFSLPEIIQEFLRKAKEEDKKLDAFLEFFEEDSLKKAKEIQIKMGEGSLYSESVIFGSPGGIKDNILIKRKLSSAASKILENYNAAYNATVIKKLEEKGAVFLGRTNMDEFEMGSSTENSAFKTTKNPWDVERVPGGSSGGPAVAVASGETVWALGSDTGGSIRQPASFCGVVGLKPTYGSVSRYGLIAMASSLDQIGPLAKTVEDAEIIFDIIKGKDFKDATSVDLNRFEKKPKELKKIRIGLPKEYFMGGMDEGTEKVIKKVVGFFKKDGFQLVEISLPHTKYALACYYIITTAEISANLARFDGVRYGKRARDIQNLKDLYFKTRTEYLGEEVKRRIILGTFVLSSGYYDAYYLKAQKLRTLIQRDFLEAFEKVDIILTPTSPTPAFKIGEKVDNPLQMYLSDIFTVPVNLAALPALSLPALDLAYGRLPVGFQLIGKPFAEKELFEVGKHYDRATDRFQTHLKVLKKQNKI